MDCWWVLLKVPLLEVWQVPANAPLHLHMELELLLHGFLEKNSTCHVADSGNGGSQKSSRLYAIGPGNTMAQEALPQRRRHAEKDDPRHGWWWPVGLD